MSGAELLSSQLGPICRSSAWQVSDRNRSIGKVRRSPELMRRRSSEQRSDEAEHRRCGRGQQQGPRKTAAMYPPERRKDGPATRKNKRRVEDSRSTGRRIRATAKALAKAQGEHDQKLEGGRPLSEIGTEKACLSVGSTHATPLSISCPGALEGQVTSRPQRSSMISNDALARKTRLQPGHRARRGGVQRAGACRLCDMLARRDLGTGRCRPVGYSASALTSARQFKWIRGVCRGIGGLAA